MAIKSHSHLFFDPECDYCVFKDNQLREEPEDKTIVTGGYNTVSGIFGSWDTEENRTELARLYREASGVLDAEQPADE